jgi:predicted pyridoxine 5'-phosphate oxidase superfamily flavin-nucleotide-binding protein
MPDKTSEAATSPWHQGEVALQRTVGVDDSMNELGPRLIRKALPEQHRSFYPLLPFIAIGAVDPGGDVWATIRAGEPGFVQSPDPANLVIRSRSDPGDPAEAGLTVGGAVGLLGIDLSSRRRNRANGRIHRRDAAAFTVAVDQVFGNCPRYIQNRNYTFTRDPGQPAAGGASSSNALDDRARTIIAGADTFFVASSELHDDVRHVDVSHRGGNTGFVRVGADGVLTIPDFSGNGFFNTLGNLLVNPKAGLVFIDFSTGDLLQMTGDAEVILQSPEIAAFDGAERLWRFKPRRVVYRPKGLPMRWSFDISGWSPHSVATGNWKDTALRREAQSRHRLPKGDLHG